MHTARRIVLFVFICLFVYLFIGSSGLSPSLTHAQTPTPPPMIFGSDTSGFFIKNKGTGQMMMRIDSQGRMTAMQNSSDSSGNLLYNPGFEENIYAYPTGTSTAPTPDPSHINSVATGWEQDFKVNSSNTTVCGPNCYYYRENSSSNVSEGGSSLAIKSGTTAGQDASVASMPVNIQSGQTYYASLDYKCSAATNFTVSVIFYNNTNSILYNTPGSTVYNAYRGRSGTSSSILSVTGCTSTSSFNTSLRTTPVSVSPPSNCAIAGINDGSTTGSSECNMARIYIEKPAGDTNIVWIDNFKFGQNITSTSTSSLNASYISSGAFGANTGGGIYSFPGNVGIGTTGPEDTLDVRGNARLRVTGSSDTSRWLGIWNGNIYTASTYAGIQFGGQVGVGGGLATYNYIRWHGSELQIANNQQVKIGIGAGDEWGNQTVYINPSGGNVGIGTTSPQYKLDVAGSIMATNIESVGESGRPGHSCLDIKTQNQGAADGVYWISPDGNAPIQVYCDMTRDGGGWTLMLKSWYTAGVAGNTGAVGAVADATTRKGNPYKLSDSAINAIIGPTQNFDIMADQNGYNSAYSTGNYEYVLLRNYTGLWRFDTIVAASSTTTTMQSYRLSDNALAWTGNMTCGTGGWGINCNALTIGNPQGGAGCDINMGTASNGGWHHFYMSETNTDTYLYICNGPQHSSSFDMNHRWWVRERAPSGQNGTLNVIAGKRLQISNADTSTATFGPNQSWGGKLLVGAGTNQGISVTAQVLSTDGNLHLDPAPSKNMYLGYYQARDIYLNPNGGNVGIGTTGPASKLDVATGSNVSVHISDLGAGTADCETFNTCIRLSGNTHSQIKLEGRGSGYPAGGLRLYYDSSVSPATGLYSTTAQKLGFGTNGSNSQLVIDTNGYVGIGTTGPNGKFEIVGSNPNIDGAVFAQATTDNNFAIQTYIDFNQPSSGWANRTTYAGGCCNNLALQPDVGTVTIGGTTGNLGYKFQVNGTANFTSTVTAPTFSGNLSGTATYANYQAATGNSNDWVQSFQQTPAHSTSFREMSGGGPSGTWWFVQNFRHSNGSNYWGRQIAWGWEDNANEMYTRNVQANSFGGWVRMINSSNINSYARIFNTWQNNHYSGTDGAEYATIFYDTNNSGYYVDPASTSNVNAFYGNEIYANSWFRNNGARVGLYSQNYGTHLYWDSAAYLRLSTNYGMQFNTSSAYDSSLAGYVYHDGGGFGLLSSDGNWRVRTQPGYQELYGTTYIDSAQANIYYDRQNTGYYVDPNGTSRMNTFYYIDQAYIVDVRPQYMYDWNDSAYYIDMNNTSRFNYLGRNYGYNWTEYDWNDTTYYMDPNNTSILNSVQANIFYDRQNTGYYVDPNGTSRMNTFYYIDQAYIVDVRPQYMYDWNDSAYYIDMNNTSRFNYLGRNYGYNWTEYDWNDTTYYMDPNNTSILNSVQANIFYDRQNTGYYVDPNSESNIWGLNTNGNVHINNITSGAGTTLVIGAGNLIKALSSSIRYKKDVHSFDTNFSNILQAQPKAFTYKSDNTKDIGYIAEDFEALGLKDLLIYNTKGQPDAIKYDKIPVYLIELIKKQQRQNDQQQKEIEELKKSLEDLKKQIEELKKTP